MRVCAVMPCYRASRHVCKIISELLPQVEHVFVVDDACPDHTGELVTASFPLDRVTVIRHAVNEGVGGATISGYRAALAAGFAVIVKLDADGQMDPHFIPDLVRPILEGTADYTKGNRFFRRDYLSRMSPVRLFGNSILSLVTKASSGYWTIMDPTNGFTALHQTAAAEIELDKVAKRYFFESDMLFRLNIARAVVRDVPIPAIYGSELSHLSVTRTAFEFPFLHLRNFVKRFVYNYVIRDFNVATVQTLVGGALFFFGTIFGALKWVSNASAEIDTPVGTVMVATLPIILGFQLLLAAASYDVTNDPVQPLQDLLRNTRRRLPNAGS